MPEIIIFLARCLRLYDQEGAFFLIRHDLENNVLVGWCI